MGKTWKKFLLLMWKNFILQKGKPIQTLFDILVPLLFVILLMIYRSQINPKFQNDRSFQPFCPLEASSVIPMNSICKRKPLDPMQGATSLRDMKLVYTPNAKPIQDIMRLFQLFVEDVTPVNSTNELITECEKATDKKVNVGIEFVANNKNAKHLKEIQNFDVFIRFPGEIKVLLDTSDSTWATNLKFPQLQFPGPRSPDEITGSTPNYYGEGFLNLQYLITFSIILNKMNFAINEESLKNDLQDWILESKYPLINMRRFPHSSWYEDDFLDAVKMLMALIILFSFLHPFVSTVKSITAEKENQLKEAMKIMGLPNWLNWVAWFVKTFGMMTISVLLLVLLLSLKCYQNRDVAVLTHADWSLLLFFLLFYVCATTAFTFAVSAFFSTANSASTVGGLIWIVSYLPYLLTQNEYDEVSLPTKLLLSILSNSAMGLGFHIILLFEIAGEGIQWNNLFNPPTPNDNLSLGIVMGMLAFDVIFYFLIALYIEALMPGKYGIPKPWYFPFTKSYWVGEYEEKSNLYDLGDIYEYTNDYFEPEPLNLYQSIQIKNLWKVFGNNIAIKGLYLNILQDQITILLGHNGAGKSTLMSLLTGMASPTKGSIMIDNYDLKTNPNNVRQSLGFCPQHNIIFDDLTVYEHLYFFTTLKGLQGDQIENEIEKYITLLEMETKRDSKASTLSGGQKRKLCVAIALCGNSKVVMLDEPTAGMDLTARRSLWNLIQSEKKGRTILFTTQLMDEADILGDRVAIMAGGKLQCCGSSFFLKRKYGAGYRLLIDKENDCDVRQVTDMLNQYVPDIEMRGSVGSELTYVLSETYLHVFEPMLLNLERKSQSMGIKGYGISLTTLEDVFMRVGANSVDDTYDTILDRNNEKRLKINVGLGPNYPDGFRLILNQLFAMFMKKYISLKRSWILFLIQITIPLFFLLICFCIYSFQRHLPPMELDLNKFKNPITIVEGTEDDQFNMLYQHLLDEKHFIKEPTLHLLPRMLDLTKSSPTKVRRKYIIGATFSETATSEAEPDITAWFNNDPYHSPGISLGVVLDTIYKMQTHCHTCSIRFINYPLPYTLATKLDQIDGDSLGYKIAFYLGLSMAFVSSLFVLFIVREINTKSKHLQFISGVKVYVFWMASIIFDMAVYITIVLLFLIGLCIIQQEGFRSPSDIGRIFYLLLCFGWAALPMVYLVGLFSDTPSSAFTLLTLFSILTGNVAFIMLESMYGNSKLENIRELCQWVFLWSPHYSLITGINQSFKLFKLFQVCNEIYERCKIEGITRDHCFDKFTHKGINICVTYESPPYFSLESFGIGKNVLISSIEGALLLAIIFGTEYKVFNLIIYSLRQIFFPKYPEEVTNEDTDVAKEKAEINALDEGVMKTKYLLAIKNLTKYFKKKVIVNGLSLGVSTHECFGLLGTNGAGKTTTFKMLTADLSITHGDAWLDSFSIRSQSKRAQGKIGYCPQFDALLDNMTCRETVIMFSLLRGISYRECKDIPDHLAKEFDFVKDVDKQVKELSGGNRRKLSAALCLIGDPPILFLDEPTSGMDPATKRYLWKALYKIRNTGKCIILTSHSMEECEALCTRIAIMVNGNFKCLGTPEHLKNKFAEGYFLTIKIRKGEIIGREKSIDYSATDLIERFISQSLPFAELKEKHEEILSYHIKDKSLSWPRLFGRMEEAKQAFEDIEDYSLSQSTLEQVFLSFTKTKKPSEQNGKI